MIELIAILMWWAIAGIAYAVCFLFRILFWIFSFPLKMIGKMISIDQN